MKPDYFCKISHTAHEAREAFGRHRIAALFISSPCGTCALSFVLMLVSLSSRAQQPDQSSTTDPHTQIIATTPYTVVARDGNQKVWSKTTWESNAITGKLSISTNSYTELATGSAHLVNGAWVDSSDEITITQTGAEATNSQHQVRFLGNINSLGAIDITLPEGDKHLASTPICLSYFDNASGRSALLGELTNSAGNLLNSGSQVLYPSCFTDIEADLLYINQIDRVEQLVIIRQQLPSPEEWGLDPASTVLQVISEFFNPPPPIITRRTVRGTVDEQLDFGIMQMVKGEAFAIGSETNTIAVTKQWLLLDGRQCLVESTPFSRLEPLLKDLPAAPAQARLQNSPDGNLHRIARGHSLPERKFTAKASQPMLIASVMPKTKGVAIDWTTLTAKTNFVFQSDTTYYVPSSVNLSATTTFEGGSVIKLAPTNSASLNVLSSSVWAGSAYRPTVITARDDDVCGEKVTGSTGNPTTNYFGSYALQLHTDSPLQYLRILYASTAIRFLTWSQNYSLSHAQLLNCSTVFNNSADDYNALTMHNVLLYNDGIFCAGSFTPWSFGEHVTLDQILNISGFVALTNSIFTGTSGFSADGTNNVFLASSSGVYQTVGAGSHYLADGSPYRNAGGTNLSTSALAYLKARTTYPPILLTNDFTTDTVLSPQAQRDTDLPDLGYHYDPLDYVISGRTLTNSTLTLNNGIALGTYGPSTSYGIRIRNNGNLISAGLPGTLNQIVRYNTVQEQSNTNWSDISVAHAVMILSGAKGNLRFTSWSLLGGRGYQFHADYPGITVPIGFTDCQFGSGTIYAAQCSTALTNCLLDRPNLIFDDDGGNHGYWGFNNRFGFGSLTLTKNGSTSWIFKDNLFDQAVIIQSGSITHSNNAYVSGYNRLTPTNANDVVLTNKPAYMTSYLGSYYYPTNDGMLSTLTNAGSRYATNATLYHYTCFTNQQKEASSMVDIGFHYVATDSNGIPIDTDGDGTPDYIEDSNGNGTLNSGETDWNSAFDLGLRVLITRPKNNSIIP